MFALLAFLLVACYNSLAHANPLGPNNGQSLALKPPLPHPVLLSSTSASSNVSARRIVVQCSDDYGIGLNLADCEDAIEHISPETHTIAFGDRHDREIPAGAVPLPWRLMGGRCIVTKNSCCGSLLFTDIKFSSSAMLYPAYIGTWCPSWSDESEPGKGCGHAIIANLWFLSG